MRDVFFSPAPPLPCSPAQEEERIDTTWRLGRMNLILHGLDADVRLGNSLLNDLHPELRADYVITNPPFNVDHWGADKIDDQDQRLQIGGRRGQITDSNANYMWMMHFLYHSVDYVGNG